MAFQQLLNARDYELISQLRLATKRRMVGQVTGEQRSPVLGGGIEFADYREYQPGDDIRQIDWAVFLRLRRLLVKLCAEEKELTLMLLLDDSRSMSYGAPSKLWQAARVAAVFAGIALQNGNRVGVYSMGAPREILPPSRNRLSLADVVKTLTRLEPEEPALLREGAQQFVARYGRKCIWVFLSDLLYPEWNQVINRLGAGGAEGYVIQVMAPEEINPPFLGEVTLVDLENAAEIPLHNDTEIARRYRNELKSFLRESKNACHAWGLHHFLIRSDASLEFIFRRELGKGGLIC